MNDSGFAARWRGLTPGQKFSAMAVLVLLVALPLALYLIYRPTRTVPKASPVTPAGNLAQLSFHPSSLSIRPNSAGQTLVQLDTGDYTVSAAEVKLTFDSRAITVTRVETGSAYFLPVTLEDPEIDINASTSVGTVKFIVGSNPETPKQGKGPIANIVFQAREQETKSTIAFDSSTAVTRVAAIEQESSVLGGFSDPFDVRIDASSSATPTPTTTSTPTPTQGATPTVAIPNASLSLTIKLTNIETATTKWLDVHLTPLSGGQIVSDSVNFASEGQGIFTGSVDAPIKPGAYRIYIKGDGYLGKTMGEATLVDGVNQLSFVDGGVQPTVGDIFGQDNVIDIFDFNRFVEHFGPRMPEGGSLADFDQDGDVDIFDYNIFVPNFGKSGDSF